MQGELDALKAEMSSQNEENNAAIASLLAAIEEQSSRLQASRRLAAASMFGMGILLAGNASALIWRLVRRRRK